MIGIGLLVFFLIPGLLSYSALYGLFHSGRAVAPEPPGVNTIEAAVVILLCSAVLHVLTALVIAGNAVICQEIVCPVRVPAAWLDPYARAFEAVERQRATARALSGLLLLALGQGALAYALARA